VLVLVFQAVLFPESVFVGVSLGVTELVGVGVGVILVVDGVCVGVGVGQNDVSYWTSKQLVHEL
jgi:hypothetical protein